MFAADGTRTARTYSYGTWPFWRLWSPNPENLLSGSGPESQPDTTPCCLSTSKSYNHTIRRKQKDGSNPHILPSHAEITHCTSTSYRAYTHGFRHPFCLRQAPQAVVLVCLSFAASLTSPGLGLDHCLVKALETSLSVVRLISLLPGRSCPPLQEFSAAIYRRLPFLFFFPGNHRISNLSGSVLCLCPATENKEITISYSLALTPR